MADEFMDIDSAAFFEELAGGSVTIQRCGGCGGTQFPPRSICTKCASSDLALVTAEGGATVVAVTTVHRAPPGFSAVEAPYQVALVRLDEEVTMLVRVVKGPDAVEIDDRVAVEPADSAVVVRGAV